MNRNKEKYIEAFTEAFETEWEKVTGFIYKETEAWDSVGHMLLITALEEKFGIELKPEEMLAIISFDEGIKVLEKKGITF